MIFAIHASQLTVTQLEQLRDLAESTSRVSDHFIFHLLSDGALARFASMEKHDYVVITATERELDRAQNQA